MEVYKIGCGVAQNTLSFSVGALNAEIARQARASGIEPKFLPTRLPRGDQHVIFADQAELDHALKIAQAMNTDASGKI